MRRLLVALITAIAAVVLSSWLLAQDFTFESQQLKVRQKAERKDLELKQKYSKESIKGGSIPKSMRDQMKHQMQREERDLRQRHKDERQVMKDRQRALKESQSGQ